MTGSASVQPRTGDEGPSPRDAIAGLRYVTDGEPGIRRRRAGRGYAYVDADGRLIRDADVLDRLRALAIPPAYTDVWICSDPCGHIQFTARDSRGRKQYRYHDRWRDVRDATKFDRLACFGSLLPSLRQVIDRDLSRPGLSREKVLALVVRLLERTHIRIGNDEYRRSNNSYGLTTLQDQHAVVEGATVRLQFRGKHGKLHQVRFADRRLARVVRRCQDLPGQALFQYVDDAGAIRSIGSGDVNAYLREVTGEDISAKDFRTWAGSCLALELLAGRSVPASEVERRRTVAQIVAEVARALGNTPAVARTAYIHPSVIDAFHAGELLTATTKSPPCATSGLLPSEQALLALITQRPLSPGVESTRAAD